MKIGANYLGDGRCCFTVWAPAARTLALKLFSGGSAGRVCPMERDSSGYWSATVEDAGPGTLYLYSIDGRDRADPASMSQPSGVHGPSEVVDHSAFAWSDHGWKNIPAPSMVIYELHAGTFTPEGRLDSIIGRLDELKAFGVNALELMPVAQFPGKRNWGYDGAFPFAVQDSYGGPEALKSLANECHARGIALIIDAVYNHFGPEGSYATEFGPYLTGRYKTPWGDAMNFDGPGSDHVREFFVQNAIHWFEHYHADALRLDAIHAIVDMSAVPFLKLLKTRVAGYELAKGRRCYLFAESDLNDTKAVSSGEYAFGLDAAWCDDFHHSFHALATGEREGYYADFGDARQLAKAMNEGYVYSGQYSAYRGRSFGSPSGHIPKERFIVFTQNHDQVGNRLMGERLSALLGFEGLKLAAGMTLLSPYIPLIFMGEEYGEEAPFLYFVDHGDERLIEAVREGRKAEFREFNWTAEPPPPESAETFARSALNWERRYEGNGAVLLKLYSTLIALRNATPCLSAGGAGVNAWCAGNGRVVMMERGERGQDGVRALALFNAGPEAAVRLECAPGRWSKALDSSAREWLGPGDTLPALAEGGIECYMPGMSFALYLQGRP